MTRRGRVAPRSWLLWLGELEALSSRARTWTVSRERVYPTGMKRGRVAIGDPNRLRWYKRGTFYGGYITDDKQIWPHASEPRRGSIPAVIPSSSECTQGQYITSERGLWAVVSQR
ncbi:predicted protein [Uncinocarpus reesii 1704]|uniref:Uncharacterized protein n=1 Tax=Uncinocarpus reesii (strain UAMH 1704) TaxID=336963 RepID=C4JQE5_UNCRE|nr:uncharacterized protein UREG_04699 [Uncinocarpus reesii 1704]EEP79853.1 predicted protein [Uncinocarpus reesii 1704]